jgi:hypothetical protein
MSGRPWWPLPAGNEPIVGVGGIQRVSHVSRNVATGSSTAVAAEAASSPDTRWRPSRRLPRTVPRPASVRISVEFRHPSWVDDEVFGLLAPDHAARGDVGCEMPCVVPATSDILRLRPSTDGAAMPASLKRAGCAEPEWGRPPRGPASAGGAGPDRNRRRPPTDPRAARPWVPRGHGFRAPLRQPLRSEPDGRPPVRGDGRHQVMSAVLRVLHPRSVLTPRAPMARTGVAYCRSRTVSRARSTPHCSSVER